MHKLTDKHTEILKVLVNTKSIELSQNSDSFIPSVRNKTPIANRIIVNFGEPVEAIVKLLVEDKRTKIYPDTLKLAFILETSINKESNKNISKILIESNNLDLTSREYAEGDTILMLAIQNNRANAVKMLIEQGIKLEDRTSTGSTALIEALQKNSYDIVKLLIDNAAKVNATNSAYKNPLDFAQSEDIKKLLIDKGAYKYLDLYNAIESGNNKEAKLLIEKGADVNVEWTPGSALHVAAQKGNINIVKDLIKAGVDKDIKDRNDKAPYDVAKIQEIEDLLK